MKITIHIQDDSDDITVSVERMKPALSKPCVAVPNETKPTEPVVEPSNSTPDDLDWIL
jgi:hypothetical protein